MSTRFTSQEHKAILSLSAIMALRMLGLFIIIPIFSPYLQTLANATPLLIGLTMGIYGLTQAVLQIPFGILSDTIGRREVITLGLALFFLGSLIAASSSNIYLVLAGRALQGAGAISGTVIAFLSDLTSEQSRTKAMAVIGMSIGASFMLAFMFGPLLNSVLSIQNIFYLIALLVLPILYILWRVVPVELSSYGFATQSSRESDIPSSRGLSAASTQITEGGYTNFRQNLTQLTSDKKLLKQFCIHSFGIFSLHGILMANFVAIPLLLKNLELSSSQQGTAYIEVFIIAILFMVPMIIIAEKKRKQKSIMFLSVLLLILSEFIFWLFYAKFWGIMLGLVIFFIGFNILEASLPSVISKLAPKNIKGAMMGVYSTAQFMGPMLGGVLAGILFKHYSLATVFILGAVWASLWFALLPHCEFKKADDEELESHHSKTVVA